MAARILVSESLYGVNFIPEIEVYEDGAIVAPSSASISLYSPSGVLMVDARVATIDSSTKRISAVFTSGESGEINTKAEDWRLMVDYEIGSVADQANFLFDSCLVLLENSVVDDDLLKLHPNLADERYEAQANFNPQIEKAFSDIKRILKEKGQRPNLLIDAAQIRSLIIAHALEIIFFDFAKTVDDIWWHRYQEMKNDYLGQWETIVLKYDSSEVGTVDEAKTFGTRELIR